MVVLFRREYLVVHILNEYIRYMVLIIQYNTKLYAYTYTYTYIYITLSWILSALNAMFWMFDWENIYNCLKCLYTTIQAYTRHFAILFFIYIFQWIFWINIHICFIYTYYIVSSFDLGIMHAPLHGINISTRDVHTPAPDTFKQTLQFY